MSRKRANNPVGVCNIIKRDSDNIPSHLTEARTYADGGNLSANLGTERDPQNGWGYLWNASVKINIPASNGDISSVSALNETGAIVPMTAIFVTDHYEITGINSDYYWNIKCWATGITPTNEEKLSYTLDGSGGESNLFTWFKTCETSGTTAYKGYGNGVNGSVVNYYEGFHAQHDVYSFLDEDGYTDSSGILIPKDSSIIAPLTDVLGNDLQYIGKVPTKAEIVGGKCWKGVTGSYYSITGLLTTDTIEVPTGSDLPTCTTNGQLVLENDSLAWDVVIKRIGVQWARLSFSESIEVPGSHIANDIGVTSGTPTAHHASLVNGSLANEVIKPISGDWLQNGYGEYRQYNDDTTGEIAHIYSGHSLEWYIKSNDTSFHLVTASTAVLYAVSGSGLNGVNTMQSDGNQVYFDDVLFTGTTSGQIYDALGIADGKLHKIKIIWAKEYEVTTFFTNSDYIGISSPVIHRNEFGEIIGQYISPNIKVPALESLNGNDALGNPLTIPQDGYSFLNCGSSLEMCRTPRIINSDRWHFWFISKDTDNFIKRQVTPYDLAVENFVSDQLFCNTNENQ